MSSFKPTELNDIAYFNPSEKLPSGTIAKKIPMAQLKEFTRKITGYELAEYKSGPKFRNHDTLVAKITPCLENGKTTYVDILDENEVAFGSSEFIVLRAKNNTCPEFLYYLSISPAFRERAISCMEGTSGRKRVNEGVLKLYKLPIPIKSEQQKIAAVLTALDKKIELNNRINAELEAMAKTLYDYWFVQFDFPDDSPQGQGKPYKTSGGKMVYNETLKREIPEGWSDSTIGKIESNIVTGKTPSRDNSEYFGGEIPFITIGDIRGNTYIVSTEETLTVEGAETQMNKFLPEDSICVTCIASPGLVGFVTTPAQTNQQINSVVCSNNFNKYYLYFAIKGYFEGAKAKTGNTFANMNKGDFSSINVLEPSSQKLELYYSKVDPLFKRIKNNSLEKLQLTQLRDWLLPMLMNGQVTVK